MDSPVEVGTPRLARRELKVRQVIIGRPRMGAVRAREVITFIPEAKMAAMAPMEVMAMTGDPAEPVAVVGLARAVSIREWVGRYPGEREAPAVMVAAAAAVARWAKAVAAAVVAVARPAVLVRMGTEARPEGAEEKVAAGVTVEMAPTAGSVVLAAVQ